MQQTASGKTMAEIITLARYLVNDSTPTYFADDTEMLAWGNAGRFEISKDGNALQTTEDIDLIANTLEYAVVNDYVKIETVIYQNASANKIALKKGSPAQVGLNYNLTVPTYWYEWNDQLGVYPTLSSVTTEKVTPYLISMPSDLTLTGSVDTPAIYDTALIYYIAAQHFFKDAKYSSSAQATAKFNDEIVKARFEVGTVEQDA